MATNIFTKNNFTSVNKPNQSTLPVNNQKGFTSQKTSAKLQQPTGKVPFFSKEGQKKSVKRVVDVFTFKPSAIVNPITDKAYSSDTSAKIVQGLTATSMIGSGAYLASLIPATATATTTATATKATTSLFNSANIKNIALAGLGGFTAGSLFRGKDNPIQQNPTTAPQYTTQTPTQNTTTNTYTTTSQDTNSTQNFKISGSPNASIFGAVSPSQSVTPSITNQPEQSTSSSQNQDATATATQPPNYLLYAVGAVLAVLILRK